MVYSVERLQASSPTLSTGYAEIANDFFPLGKLIFAASMINAAEDAQETSRAFLILKCHSKVDFPVSQKLCLSLPLLIGLQQFCRF